MEHPFGWKAVEASIWIKPFEIVNNGTEFIEKEVTNLGDSITEEVENLGDSVSSISITEEVTNLGDSVTEKVENLGGSIGDMFGWWCILQFLKNLESLMLARLF